MLSSALSLTREHTIYGSFLTLIAYIYGLISTPLFWILVFFSLFDFLIGSFRAWKNKEWMGEYCLNGIASKVFIGALVLMSAMVDFALATYGIYTQGIFHNFIMGALITKEFGSIIENADKADLWVPSLFKEAKDKIERRFRS